MLVGVGLWQETDRSGSREDGEWTFGPDPVGNEGGQGVEDDERWSEGFSLFGE